jgi:hypothetical protein
MFSPCRPVVSLPYLATHLLPLIIFLLALCSAPYLGHAQQSGLSIKPAIVDPTETLDPGTEKQYTVSIENLNSAEQIYYLFTRNIKGVEDGGIPIFTTDNSERTGYELAEWIELPYSEVTIPAGGQVSVDFTLRVPEVASPGSHLGGIFISVDPPEIEKSGAAVGYQVAIPVSVRVSGDILEEASIRQFSTSKFLYGSQNVDFEVRIENKGNVIVKPTGPLEIFNMLGNRVGILTFNEDNFSVLPKFMDEKGEIVSDGTREFTGIKWEGDSTGFGRYEAVLSPVYGDIGAKKTMSSTVTFWILPMNIIGPALIIFALILLIVFVFVRLYIRRSLAHISHGRRVIYRQKRGNSSALLLIMVVTLTVTALFLIVLLALFA